MFNVLQRTLTDIRGSVFTEGGVQKTEQVKYTVRKLADGNVWMTENLALNWSSTRDFTPADTNVKNTIQVDMATQSLDGSNPAAGSTEAEAWKNADMESWLSRSSNKRADSVGRKYGTYYNWYTAAMGSPTGTATEDICPKGWKLPNSSANGSFMYLFRDTYNLIASGESEVSGSEAMAKIQSFPFLYFYSGIVGWNSGVFTSDHGLYWTTNAYSSTAAAALFLNGTSTTIYPSGTGHTRKGGAPIRCVSQR